MSLLGHAASAWTKDRLATPLPARSAADDPSHEPPGDHAQDTAEEHRSVESHCAHRYPEDAEVEDEEFEVGGRAVHGGDDEGDLRPSQYLMNRPVAIGMVLALADRSQLASGDEHLQAPGRHVPPGFGRNRTPPTRPCRGLPPCA